MSTKRWLPTMLRARAATEDAAAQRLAGARRDHEVALSEAALENQRLDRLMAEDANGQRHDGPAFLAAAAARSAAAATHAAALHRSRFADRRVATGVEELNQAAQQRRTVEKLAERLAAEAHRTELQVAQRELDDVTITRFGRGNRSAS